MWREFHRREFCHSGVLLRENVAKRVLLYTRDATAARSVDDPGVAVETDWLTLTYSAGFETFHVPSAMQYYDDS